MPRRVQGALSLVLVVGLGLVALAVVLVLVSGERISLGSDQEPPKLEEENGRLVVGSERIPSSYEEALASTPLALLPNHLPAHADEVAVTAEARTQLESATALFLSRWETFRPYQAAYAAGISPLALPSARDEIVSRSESLDMPEACAAGTGCLVALAWRGGEPRIEIRMLDDSKAWITTYGLVEARPLAEGTDPAGGLYERAYALLLRRDDLHGTWLVERIIAETVRGDIGA